MSDFRTITYAVAERAATITLNRPEALNPMGVAMAGEVLEAVHRAGADPAVRVVVITGAGRAFSSGADLSPSSGAGLTPEGKLDVLTPLREAYNPLMLALRELPKPVVAAVNGGAVGIAAALVAHCDLAVAAESAYFLLAFANIGLTLDGGASVAFARRLGAGRAAELALLGERLPVARALDWGLVNQIVADAELVPATGELAARLAAGAPGSYAASKQLINAAVYHDFAERLDAEAVAQQQRAASADFAEGVTAFFQKRKPEFKGE